MSMKLSMLPISSIEENVGQLEGLPKNPRRIKKTAFEKLINSIKVYPEMLSSRALLVYPCDDAQTRFVVVGGNMRLRAMLELGYTDCPVFIIPRATSIERLQAYSILDNGDFGEWDWDILVEEWPVDSLADWGISGQVGVGLNIDDWFNNLDADSMQVDKSIIVHLPADLVDQRDQIKLAIESTLSNYAGIKIK